MRADVPLRAIPGPAGLLCRIGPFPEPGSLENVPTALIEESVDHIADRLVVCRHGRKRGVGFLLDADALAHVSA